MGHDSNKRPWRILVKKMQRKRKRQKMAQERDKQLEEDELNKLKDPLYKSWLDNQQEKERLKMLAAEKERQEQEKQWMRRELIAQKQFHRDEQKRKLQEAEKEAKKLHQELELKKQQDAWQKKCDELKKQSEKAVKEFEDTMDCMQQYLEDVNMKTPTNLEKYVESRPGEKLCEFYEKTNCCRFGAGCTFNHKRPILSNIIVIRHFFQHPLLEQQEHEEYARADANLELNERDLRDSYDDFCGDVWPELEEFGNVINFRTVRNIQSHLRGHVFVEFKEKRSALKAFINLQNRYYASKRLNVEFSNLRHWRTGVCGMLSVIFIKGLSLDRRCSKGFKCNFLHLMQNPNYKYNTPMESPGRTAQSANFGSKIRLQTPLLSWNNMDSTMSSVINAHNWRWSESPEVELKSSSTPDIVKTSKESSLKSSGALQTNEKSSKEENSHSKHRRSVRSKSPSNKKSSNAKHFNKSRHSKSPSTDRSKNHYHQSRHSGSPLTKYDKTQGHHSRSLKKEKSSKHYKIRRSKSKSPSKSSSKSKSRSKSKKSKSPKESKKGKKNLSDKSTKESDRGFDAECKSKKHSKHRSRSHDKDTHSSSHNRTSKKR